MIKIIIILAVSLVSVFIYEFVRSKQKKKGDDDE